MYLETRTVGRKTPQDGKLEIGKATAERLALLGATLRVSLMTGSPPNVASGPAAVSAMSCTCARSQATGIHEHLFLESPVLRSLAAEDRVTLALDDAGVVHISAPPAE
jgi:hypothetical protein